MCLIAPAVVGLAFQSVIVAGYWNQWTFSSPVTPFYCMLIAMWSILVMEYWKRREVFIAMENGMIGHEMLEQDRPEFKGDFIASPINGEPVKYYPKGAAKCWAAVSFTITGMIVLMALGIITRCTTPSSLVSPRLPHAPHLSLSLPLSLSPPSCAASTSCAGGSTPRSPRPARRSSRPC